jgi:hypothetical protein
MSDKNLTVEPTPPIRGAAPVQPVRPERPAGPQADQRPGPHGNSPAASTGGNLRAAYTQFVVDPSTQDVVVKILDAATDQVLSELPSKEIQAMQAYLKNYADTLARHKAALHSTSN